MDAPEHSGKERRVVPRHLRDGENDLLSTTGAFGQRAGDALSRRGRKLALAVIVAGCALAAWWFAR
jgi:hypothetical protein